MEETASHPVSSAVPPLETAVVALEASGANPLSLAKGRRRLRTGAVPAPGSDFMIFIDSLCENHSLVLTLLTNISIPPKLLSLTFLLHSFAYSSPPSYHLIFPQ